MTLRQLFEQGELSTRAYGICTELGITTTKELEIFNRVHGGFSKVRNCGALTNLELLSFCNYKPTSTDEKPVSTSENHHTPPLLAGDKLDLVNAYIEYLCDLLSVRSRNALKKYLDDEIDFHSIYLKLLNNNIQIGSIPNVGTRTEKEITTFLKGVSDYIQLVQTSEDNTENERVKLLLLQSHNISVGDDQVPGSLFALVHLVLHKTDQLTPREKDILFATCNIDDTTEPIDTITVARSWGLSPERVRQLRTVLFGKLIHIIEEIYAFDPEVQIDHMHDWVLVDDSMQAKINQEAKTSFSKPFIALVLSIFLKERFHTVCKPEEVLFRNTTQKRTRHTWKNIFLVSSDLHNKLNIKYFVDHVFKIRQKKRKTPLKTPVSDLLPSFVTLQAGEKVKNAEPLMCEILLAEFNLKPDENNQVTFEANAHRPIRDYLYDILDRTDRIMNLDEVTNKMQAEFPQKQIKPNSIRSYLINHPDIVAVGRQNKYGLKKWEVEKSDFRGGTIGDIIKEYLRSQKFPRTMHEIVPVVLKYRPESNYKSINAIPGLDQTGEFIFYEGGLLGLRSKTYKSGPSGESLIERKKIPGKSWSEYYRELESFCQNKQRLPSLNPGGAPEPALYRWFCRQKKRPDISARNKSRLRILEKKYGEINTDIRVVKRLNRLEQIKTFIEQHGRLPDYQRKDEKKLHSAYYREKRKYEANELPGDLKRCFEEILSLI